MEENEVIEKGEAEQAEPAEETAVTAVEEGGAAETKQRSKGLAQFIQILKFTAFSISAGVIQFLSFAILYEWTNWLPWWPAHLISVVLSVIWNFTLNRKFTFRTSGNIPIAMTLVVLYYCAYIPLSVFGGKALEEAWGKDWGLVVELLMMVINFVTEFIYDKFLVFNDKVVKKIENAFRRK